MTSAATIARPASARQKAREPMEMERPPDREMVRPGALTFKHPLTGEILTRDPRPTSNSPYHIPPEIVPSGMVYQWRRESIVGEPDHANMSALKRNGWREVPSDRHPDRPCRMDGLVLMECPEPFVAASRAEDHKMAMIEKNKQRRPRNESTRPGYLDDEHPAARGLNFARRGMPEPSDPALRPVYQRDVDIDS